MKNIHLYGPLAVLLLCLLSFPLLAQFTALDTEQTMSRQQVPTEAKFTYSGVSISAPAFYAGEEFRISLTVQNTGSKAGQHDIVLYLQDTAALNARRKVTTKQVKLGPGQDKSVAFTLRAEDLLQDGKKAPESFVFFVGEYEIGVDYLKE